MGDSTREHCWPNCPQSIPALRSLWSWMWGPSIPKRSRPHAVVVRMVGSEETPVVLFLQEAQWTQICY